MDLSASKKSAKRLSSTFTVAQNIVFSAILLYLLPFYPLELSILLILGLGALSFFYPAGAKGLMSAASILPLLNNFGIAGGMLVWLAVTAALAADAHIGSALSLILFTGYSTYSLPGLIGRSRNGLKEGLMYFVTYLFSLSVLFRLNPSGASFGTFGGSFAGKRLANFSSPALSAFFRGLPLQADVGKSFTYFLTDSAFYAFLVTALMSMAIAGAIVRLAMKHIKKENRSLRNHLLASLTAIPASAAGGAFFMEFSKYIFPLFGTSYSASYYMIAYAAVAGFILTLLSKMRSAESASPLLNQPQSGDRKGDSPEQEVKFEPIFSKVKWSSIYGLPTVKRKMLEIAQEILDEKKAYGILLFGPPGTGKTMLARALANKLNWKYIELNTADILSPWYGVAERNLDTFFRKAKMMAPIVVFVDEIEGITLSRSSQDIHESTRRVINLFLTRIQDFHNENVQVVFLGATNLPEEIDEALLRPGRFDEVIYVPVPDKDGLKAIWKGYLKDTGIAVEKLAEKSQRFTPADIANMVQIVRRRGKREKRTPTEEDYLKAVESFKPSVSFSSLARYEELAKKYSREKMQTKSMYIPDVKWNDVIGLEEVKQDMKEAIETPIKHRDIAEELGIKPAKGILLFGPPGTGKTMLAKAVANELKTSFILVTGDELSRAGPYNVANEIKEKFNLARDNSPAIVFIDEIDMVARSRASSEWRNALTQMLTEMDGITSQSDIVVIGATNTPWDIDNALTRGGRLEKIIYVPLPGKSDRSAIINTYLTGLKADPNDIEELARKTEGYSPADLKLIAEEIKRSLFREAVDTKVPRTEVGQADIMSALGKVSKSTSEDQARMYDDFASRRGSS